MPLPGAVIEPKPAPALAPVTEPVKRNFNDYDSLIAELNAPKEQIINTPPPGSAPVPGAPPAERSIFSPGESLAEPITPEAAARSGARIAKTFDKVFSFGASLYAKSDNRKAYEAGQGEIEDLSDAWSDVAMKYSFKIEDSPWFNLILLMLAVYTPIVMKARTDHRFAVLSEQMEENRRRQEEENQAIRERIEKIELEKLKQ